MIEVMVNGQPESIENGISVTALLRQLGLGEKRVAVELNREIVPRSRHAETRLKPDDRVEIVQAIGGG